MKQRNFCDIILASWEMFGMHHRLFIILLSSILLLFSSCTKQEKETLKIPREDRKWLTQFFNDTMFFENGIYTLWGSKPLTLMAIPNFSDEEYQAFYDALTEEEKSEELNLDGYDLPNTWEKWEQISARYPMNKYKLFKTDLFQDDHYIFVFFVNILKTAMTIQDNYEAFRKAVDFDFNPLEVTLEIDQKDSKFWQKTKDHSHLWGLLFGFGKMNSYAFQWKYFDHPKSCNEFCKLLNTSSSNKKRHDIVKYNINDFQIPGFMSFEDNDEVVELYNLEKIKIQKQYKGKDFLDLTLQKLMS